MSASEKAGTRAALLAFGHLVKRLRLAADLTQEELAERASVSPRLISDLERGSTHRPRRDTVELLADGFRLRGDERENFIALARGRPRAPEEGAASAAAARRTLPHPPTPIVGRLKETAAATGLLLDPERRLLTLTGLGGVGKTRLALEVALKTGGAFRDGVVFVDLAPVRDPRLVITAIAQALGVVPSPAQPLQQQVSAALQDKQLLLVLDNFEHVLDAATVVADLLASSPALKVLATSREPLHLRAEHEYPIGPLATPDLDDLPPLNELAEAPAIALLVRRAEAVDHAFALTEGNARAVAELTVRLDGLPLAIELAATRLRILSPADLLARLERRLPLLTGGARDLPGRQQAIRATLDWSHDLLSETEQSLFRRLAVFAGGCPLEAAEWVADGRREAEGGRRTDALVPRPPTPQHPDTPTPSTHTLDLLGGLVEKSLLRATAEQGDERRFGMLETIREYGLELLVAAGEEEEARDRHRTWYLDLAERAEPELTGPEQGWWFARLQREHDNLRGALRWAIARRQTEAALRFGGALYRFWANQGHYEEGRRWLEQALALDAEARSSARGHALLGVGVMVYFQGEYDRAASLWREAQAIFRELGETRGIAYTYGNLGLAADGRGDFEEATAAYEAALALFRELDDRMFVSFMSHNLGLIAYFQGDYARAAALFEETLVVARERGDDASFVLALGNLGLVAFAEGNYDRARTLNTDALRRGRHLDNRPWLARGIEHLALVEAADGDAARAARLFGAAAALRERFGAATAPHDREFSERHIATARARIGEDAFAAAWADGAAMSLEDAIADALDERDGGRRKAEGGRAGPAQSQRPPATSQ
jgi:predicted ATPase/DNA-binding XRE family transcriptional regulator